MLRYKGKSFYNKYFNKVNDFKLISPFEEHEGGFKGVIESIGTYHPIIRETDWKLFLSGLIVAAKVFQENRV